jgi:succinate-semialdehyde dehydrogenase/glutarate-semialdehyde dehydrogenase
MLFTRAPRAPTQAPGIAQWRVADAIGFDLNDVAIHTTMVGGADSPFGGVKDSGHGSEDGPEGLEACLVTKAIHQA